MTTNTTEITQQVTETAPQVTEATLSTGYLAEYFAELTSSAWQWDLVGINLSMIIGFLFLFKFGLAALADVSIKDELAEKDNPAFGITLAFSFLSFFLIMGAASTGDDRVILMQEIQLMAGYGVAGMLMLFISKLLFDNVAMKSFCLQEQIRQRNVAAALVDGTNVLATAIIVFTYMGWVKGTSFESLQLVAFGWIVSQVLLTALSFIRGAIFSSKDGKTLHDAIKDGNLAVAIRYSSYKVSFAMTALISSSHYPYEVGGEDNLWYATAIFLSSILLSVAVKIVSAIAKKMILPSIDFADEINFQKNTGLAMIEALIVIGVTVAAYGLLR